jgi:hypothetical protein
MSVEVVDLRPASDKRLAIEPQRFRQVRTFLYEDRS